MGITKELFQFRGQDLEEVLRRMGEMAARHDGKEWLNVQPWVDEATMPKASLLRHVFSGRGFSVPTATWVPGHPKSSPPNITQIGIQHGAGNHALRVLVDGGMEIAEDWRSTQDHTRRGLVFELPATASLEDSLNFMLEVAQRLAPDLQIEDRWIAGFVTQN